MWRFFGRDFPFGGVDAWNSALAWKHEWGILSGDLYAIGEDVLGNQLVLRPSSESVWLWNHEDGSLQDLLLDPPGMLRLVCREGLGWVDHYGDGSLAVAGLRAGSVPPESHLHRTVPLILGGTVEVSNTTIVERLQHLVGHAKLWREIRGIPPGEAVVAKPPQGR